MEIFPRRPNIDWIGKRYAFFSITLVLQLWAMGSLYFRGLNYGIEFTGGAVVQLTYAKPQTLEGLRRTMAAAGHADALPQQFTGTNTFEIRLKTASESNEKTIDLFLEKLQAADPDNPFRVDKKDYVGPAVGKHLFRQAMIAVILSLLGIVVYVAFRFSNVIWGVAGVIALAHDVVATFGLYSFFRCEMNLVLIAAILTIGGYSMHDTIVVYDRMREKMRLLRKEPLGDVINASINETLSRSIITSMTTFIAVLTLYLTGGHVIHDFAFGMVFGVIVGTYSSVAVAAPIVYQWVLHSRPEQLGNAAGGLNPPPKGRMRP